LDIRFIFWCSIVQISENNIEIGVVNDQKMFRVLTPAEILDYLGEVE